MRFWISEWGPCSGVIDLISQDSRIRPYRRVGGIAVAASETIHVSLWTPATSLDGQRLSIDVITVAGKDARGRRHTP
jgi:hypothetical protein